METHIRPAFHGQLQIDAGRGQVSRQPAAIKRDVIAQLTGKALQLSGFLAGNPARQSDADRLEDLTQRADEQAKTRAEAKAATAKAKAEAETMAAHCKQVRDQLGNLLVSTRKQFVNDQGEREFVDETLRQKWIKEAQDEIAKNCSG